MKSMKRLIVTGALVLSMIFTLGLASDASADGRAAALLVSTADGSVVALVDFNDAQFTLAEANQLAGLLQIGGLLLPGLIADQAPGVSVNAVVFTPSQMAGFGLGDADVANNFILSNLAVLGAEAYIKAVATKVNPPPGTGVIGQNIRLDLFILASGFADTLQYVASVEVPEQLINDLSGLLSF